MVYVRRRQWYQNKYARFDEVHSAIKHRHKITFKVQIFVNISKTYSGTMRKVKQMSHNLIGVVVIAISKQEGFTPALTNTCEKRGQAFVLLDILV